jgi:hypothetical protein
MSTLDERVPKEVAVSADSILAATAKLGTGAAGPPPASFRMWLISLLSGAIGPVAGIAAFALYKLIEVFIAFSSSVAGRLTSPARNTTIWVGWSSSLRLSAASAEPAVGPA